ncbi:WD40-repeat-containing domain protein [Xylariaceae sp. FL0016]|nr:WD40-repeat-containing domain protein [Xylariaceae sp. FL0016]
MAPVAVPESHLSKRKREADEHARRKRAKRERSLAKQTTSNGQSSRDEQARSPNSRVDLQDADGHMPLSPSYTFGKESRKHGQTDVHECGLVLAQRSPKWTVSRPMGGRILNIDPILSDDEKYLILAYNTSVQVYSAVDSLLIRQIHFSWDGHQDQIVSIRPSTDLPSHICVATSSGRIWLVDWTTDNAIKTSTRVKCDLLCDMSLTTVKLGSSSREIALISAKRRDNWLLLACDLHAGDGKATSKVIFTNPSAIQNLCTDARGCTVAASSRETIIVGWLISENMSHFEDLQYELFSFEAGDDITCMDLRVTERVHLNRKSIAETGTMPVVEVVVGCARGPVLVYSDLLSSLAQDSRSQQNSIQPQKYHWHRKSVHTVKWSRDGNYIISGGSESTLVVWQLDTMKKEFLPHLSACIENIVISTRGSAYVIHLDDNSVMVLSTAEMKPTAYVSGIQSLVSPRPLSKDNIVQRIGQYPQNRLWKTPTATSPSKTSQLLLCVGNGQQPTFTGSGPSTPLVQTLDVTTLQSMSKQALTRTNPTDVNINAQGYAITEPRITNMIYSFDGRWLATTDEWQPPSRDVGYLDGSSSDRMEVHLKFWSVPQGSRETPTHEQQQEVSKDAKNTGEGRSQHKSANEPAPDLRLVSRINSPHHTSLTQTVFDVAADPTAERFATVGGDGIVRLWQPTARQRDGVLVKGQSGQNLQTWVCSREVHLPGSEASAEIQAADYSIRVSGALAFSEDGSTLVCAIVQDQGSTLHIIDTETCQVRDSLSGLINGDVQGVKVLSSQLVVLSDTLMVYDLVFDELRYGIQLRTNEGIMNEETHGPGTSIMTHLAVDHKSQRFAVAVTRAHSKSQKPRSEIAVFNTDNCEPEIVQKFRYPITSLVSAGSNGFLVLDSAAQLWSVNESMNGKSLAFAQPLADLQLDSEPKDEAPEADTTLAIMAGGDSDESDNEDAMDVDMAEGELDGGPSYPAVVAPQRLTELFDAAPPFAMPPIEDMFYQVTKLFAPKYVVPTA